MDTDDDLLAPFSDRDDISVANLAMLLGVPKEVMARVLRIESTTEIVSSKAPQSLLLAHRVVSLIRRLSAAVGGINNASVWLKAQRAEVGDAPLYLLAEGRFDVVEDLVQHIELGQPG